VKVFIELVMPSLLPRESIDSTVFTEGFDTADLKDAKALLDELHG
jgi:hypothetical protein